MKGIGFYQLGLGDEPLRKRRKLLNWSLCKIVSAFSGTPIKLYDMIDSLKGGNRPAKRRISLRICFVVNSFCLIFFSLALPLHLHAQKVVFSAPGNNFGVWRLTHEPQIRTWANRYNTQCFSPDGRFVCYTHFPTGNNETASVRIFDLHEDEERVVGPGFNARWARQNNWLIYSVNNPAKAKGKDPGTENMFYDADTSKTKVLVPYPGAVVLGETDTNDQWIYGSVRERGATPGFRTVRISLPEGDTEFLPQVTGIHLLPNPRHPLFFTREESNTDPFAATRAFFDLDGGNRRIGVPTLQKCHMSWLGNGEYFMLGDGLFRGRKWNEPFPSNVHILAWPRMGDVSSCGTNGRWACGDSVLADLRSGDGWETVHPLSQLCFPANVADNSEIYDADPKGSPDGTKIGFVTNYPLDTGPVTRITKVHDDRLDVVSTEGFPDNGEIVVKREIITYRRKTPTSFHGLIREVHNTEAANLGQNKVVTSFQARCLTDQQFRSLEKPSTSLAKAVNDMASPLMRQRMTDMHLVVVRRPDRPHLRLSGDFIELIPGENHREIIGYHLVLGDERFTKKPLALGALFTLAKSGDWRAIAVEHSGLESEPSLPVDLPAGELSILSSTPADFSWTRTQEKDGVVETVHLHDGVIRRDWLQGDTLVKRHDLNATGQATRRITFKSGRIDTREYYNHDDLLVSRETFDASGFIIEQARFLPDPKDGSHVIPRENWHYERGMPILHIWHETGREYFKKENRWGYLNSTGEFIDTPRE